MLLILHRFAHTMPDRYTMRINAANEEIIFRTFIQRASILRMILGNLTLASVLSSLYF